MILFTADWHIKLGQKNVPMAWACTRYKLFFEQIHELEKDEDISMHIIGGDLFDRVPSMDEITLYFDFIKDVTEVELKFKKLEDVTVSYTRTDKTISNPPLGVSSSIKKVSLDLFGCCLVDHFLNSEIASFTATF